MAHGASTTVVFDLSRTDTAALLVNSLEAYAVTLDEQSREQASFGELEYAAALRRTAEHARELVRQVVEAESRTPRGPE